MNTVPDQQARQRSMPRGRKLMYVGGAVLIVAIVVVLSQMTTQPVEPAEADGDPDLGQLPFSTCVILTILALSVYGGVIGIVELLVRKTASPRAPADPDASSPD